MKKMVFCVLMSFSVASLFGMQPSEVGQPEKKQSKLFCLIASMKRDVKISREEEYKKLVVYYYFNAGSHVLANQKNAAIIFTRMLTEFPEYPKDKKDFELIVNNFFDSITPEYLAACAIENSLERGRAIQAVTSPIANAYGFRCMNALLSRVEASQSKK